MPPLEGRSVPDSNPAGAYSTSTVFPPGMALKSKQFNPKPTRNWARAPLVESYSVTRWSFIGFKIFPSYLVPTAVVIACAAERACWCKAVINRTVATSVPAAARSMPEVGGAPKRWTS